MKKLTEKDYEEISKPLKLPIWRKTKFWYRVEKSFLYIGPTVTGTLVLNDADRTWTLIVIGSTIVGGFVGFWFNDDNKDGIADIFQ
jgi:hypothetical protein